MSEELDTLRAVLSREVEDYRKSGDSQEIRDLIFQVMILRCERYAGQVAYKAVLDALDHMGKGVKI